MLCRLYGISTYATLMFNTPEETEDDIEKTIGLMNRIRATNYGINLTVPYPGTEIYEKYVFPKLTKESYYIYNDPELSHAIPDPRFRLASHKRDLDKLYINVLLKFTIWRKILDVTFNVSYWATLFNSKRKKDYIVHMLEGFKRQVNVFWRYLSRLALISSRRG